MLRALFVAVALIVLIAVGASISEGAGIPLFAAWAFGGAFGTFFLLGWIGNTLDDIRDRLPKKNESA